MGKADEKYFRYRLSVPIEDKDVIAWINAQDSVSFSLRTLIRQSISNDGIIDITCKPVTPHMQDSLLHVSSTNNDPEKKLSSLQEKTSSMIGTSNSHKTKNNNIIHSDEETTKQNIQQPYTNPVDSPGKVQQNSQFQSSIKKDADGFVDPADFL